MWAYSPIKIDDDDDEEFDYFLVFYKGTLDGAFRVQTLHDAQRLTFELNYLEAIDQHHTDLMNAAYYVLHSYVDNNGVVQSDAVKRLFDVVKTIKLPNMEG